MRFVTVKSNEQLDLQALHRIRERLVGQRTSVINQIRAFLIEYGLPVKAGRASLRRDLPGVLEDAGNGLSDRMRQLVYRLRAHCEYLDESINQHTHVIELIAKRHGDTDVVTVRKCETESGDRMVRRRARLGGMLNFYTEKLPDPGSL
jgi:transposase